MPRNTITATSAWQLLTTTDVTGRFVIQMRGYGRLYVARGDGVTAPPAGEGLFFNGELDGISLSDLAMLDPGGTGARIWARFEGTGTSDVWCSWVDTP